MTNRKPFCRPACALLAAALLVGVVAEARADEGYYKVQPIYIPYPEPGKNWNIRNYGPVGIGIDLISPAFTMRISNVEKGSPADATGKLKKGQIIESINGQVLKDIDPRVQLANILGEVEATDGRMRLKIKDVGEVVVQLPVLGAYSETWPRNCPKSDRIVRNLAELLAKQDKPHWGSVLFLLSTGEEQDLDVVRRWMKDFKGVGSYPWFNGLLGPGVCEYYLRTGDASVLPAIKQMTEELKKQFYCGSWSGRGKASFTYMGGGHMNAAGVHCLTFLLLARQCGVDVDEYMLQSALKHFYRFAGHGNVAYGDQFPEGGYRDNGKTGGLALAMSAAAQLTPQGENSVYAKARDNAAMKSFYASSWFNRAHTGGGIGEIWHADAMQLMVDKKPQQYRSFMDERRWHFELSRRPDGSFGVHDGARYDVSATQSSQSWGTFHALAYTASRKKLRLFGAPPTPWCKTYPLPERPWGTPADDVFQSLEPAEYKPGLSVDMSKERIPTDASAPLMGRIGQPDVSDDTLMMYAHHPEYGFRIAAVRVMTRQGRAHLIVPLLKSKDPRVREAGLEAISGMFKGKPLADSQLTDEMFDLIGRMIEDPNESWWVAQEAMKALARAKPEQIGPHVDRLVHFLRHEDWWLHTSAMKAVAKVAADERYYRKVLPAVADIVKTARNFNSTNAASDIIKAVQNAKPAVKQFASKLFFEAYAAIPDPVIAPGGQITPNQTEVLRSRAYGFARALPGNEQIIMQLPKLTSRWQASRRESDKFYYNGRFVTNSAIVGTWKVVDEVKTIDAFKPDPSKKLGRLPYKAITFKNDGQTDNGDRRWTGNMLIDMGRGEALQMTVKRVDGDAYLFIEAGGFGGDKPADWRTTYYVLRKTKS